MKSRAHQVSKYRAGVAVMSGSRSVPFVLFAGPVGDDGWYVAKFTQSVLMSSSMARTAPALTSRLARSVILRSGPAT